jgi:DUF4097 and DUF4098 domain-containing protein YvlB
MPRSLILTVLLLLTAVASLPAQNRTRDSGFGRQDWCEQDSGDRRRASHCEIREETLPGQASLDVDARTNGGIRVRGWDSRDTHLRARISASARTESRARDIVDAVRIVTEGGRIRPEGPSLDGNEYWSVSFELQVPRDARLRLDARNGGIAIEDFRGSADFRTTNGGISVVDVSGDIRGETTNGGVSVDLSGRRWEGAGLDLETRNGGVRMTIPDDYSAELETGTVNGGLRIDFPITVQGNLRDFSRRISTRLGSGGARIRAVTTNGGVTITRR